MADKICSSEKSPKRMNYVFACTCKKTKPKPNPKSVIPKQQAAVVTISPIIFSLKKL
jgi:hypothetical protein